MSWGSVTMVLNAPQNSFARARPRRAPPCRKFAPGFSRKQRPQWPPAGVATRLHRSLRPYRPIDISALRSGIDPVPGGSYTTVRSLKFPIEKTAVKMYRSAREVRSEIDEV